MPREHILVTKVFGSELDRMKRDRPAVFEALKDSNWEKRFAALVLLYEHWDLSPDILLPLCHSVITDDGEVQVKCRAIHTIGRMLEGTGDVEQSRYLAKLVVANDVSNKIRCTAFLELKRINGLHHKVRSIEEGLEIGKKLRELAVSKVLSPEDVEWASAFTGTDD